jgi:hypothetical protein
VGKGQIVMASQAEDVLAFNQVLATGATQRREEQPYKISKILSNPPPDGMQWRYHAYKIMKNYLQHFGWV